MRLNRTLACAVGLNASLYLARYGAFPSDTTWYVTVGEWPESAQAKARRGSKRALTHRVSISNTTMALDLEPRVAANDGYSGAISKTVRC